MIKWDVSKEDFAIIVEIADRAEKMLIDRGGNNADDASKRRRNILMDLTAAHANGCPLDLDRLLEAPDGDFAHDVFGISREIDRETGHLGCFLPRFAKREKASAS